MTECPLSGLIAFAAPLPPAAGPFRDALAAAAAAPTREALRAAIVLGDTLCRLEVPGGPDGGFALGDAQMVTLTDLLCQLADERAPDLRDLIGPSEAELRVQWDDLQRLAWVP